MSGDRKQEACNEFDSFELLVGPEGVKQILECEGVFPAEFTQAKAFCGRGRATINADSQGEELCKMARAQARLSV